MGKFQTKPGIIRGFLVSKYRPQSGLLKTNQGQVILVTLILLAPPVKMIFAIGPRIY